MNLFATGISYRTAPVELREKLAVSPSKVGCAACRVKIGAGLSEVVLLCTCNRVEVYGVAPRVNGNVDSIFRHLTASPQASRAHSYVYRGAEAIRHLFAVASGLDSMVLGETEITGQVKQAYEQARAVRLTGGVLNRVFQKALQTAKEIRTRTRIGRGATSVGSVAVELAEKIFGPELVEKAVMIIGAGKMGEACVRHLAKKGAKAVLVSNRSFERAVELAGTFRGRAIRFDDCTEAMVETDIVVSSTGCPQTILHRDAVEAVMRKRRHRPLVLIDIAVPRDIAPAVGQINNVYLYNIDDLAAIVSENQRLRAQELTRCHEILAERAQEVMARLVGRPVETGTPTAEARPGFRLFQPAVCGT